MSWWTLETLMITPGLSSARNCLIASRAHRNEPRRLTASTLSKSALESSSDGREIWMPALLTSTSMPPSSLDRLADHAHDLVLLGDVALHEHVANALLVHAVHAGVHLLLGVLRLVRAAQVVDRDVRAVLGEATAIAWPMPEVPPVTSTFLPLRPGMPSVRVLLGAVAIRVSWSGDAAQSLTALRRYAPLGPRIFRIWTITRPTSGFSGALIAGPPQRAR